MGATLLLEDLIARVWWTVVRASMGGGYNQASVAESREFTMGYWAEVSEWCRGAVDQSMRSRRWAVVSQEEQDYGGGGRVS